MRNQNFLLGAMVGAGLVYMTDPQNGRRRRALMRDKLVRAGHVTRDAIDTTTRDALNRGRGIIAASRARLGREDVPDEVLLERVRSKLGRVCSHPHAVDVMVHDGHVTLRGPVLADEMAAILRTARAVRGVQSVSNELDMHQSAEGVPALQGQGRLGESEFDVLQRNWAPSTRAMVAAAGLAATGLWMATYTRRSQTAV